MPVTTWEVVGGSELAGAGVERPGGTNFVPVTTWEVVGGSKLAGGRGGAAWRDELVPITTREVVGNPEGRRHLPAKDHPYHSHEKNDDEPHEHKLGHAHLARLPECFSDHPRHGPDHRSDGARIHKSR